MVTSNKDAAKIWAEIEKARNVTPKEERGANDLERRIDDLMAINKKHQQQNGDLMKDIIGNDSIRVVFKTTKNKILLAPTIPE
jgi:hypothetical protein